MAPQPDVLNRTEKQDMQRESQDITMHFNEAFKWFYTIKVEISFSGFHLSHRSKGGGG